MLSHDLWWGLSGPSGFVTSLADDLRSGRNIVIALPEHHPSDLATALHERLVDDGRYGLRRLELSGEPPEACHSPARLIHDRFAPLTDPLIVPSARTVALAPALSGTVIWVSGLSSNCWATWSRFLDQYKDACRIRPEYDRCLLAMPQVGEPSSTAPRDELTLAVHRWEGVVHRIDMLIYLSRQFERSRIPPAFRDLAVAIAVEIAGTDLELADRLADAPFEQVVEPHNLLIELARECGWLTGRANPPAWHRGMSDRRDDRPFPHSAAEIVAGRRQAIDRRVWRGQVAILYPLLEDLRLQFVNQFRHLLSVPYCTDHDTIHQVEGLELVHLLRQLRPRLSARRLAPLQRCKDARNELAHLRPLSIDLLLDPDFSGLLG
jgi:hypothetical protein